MCLLIKGAFVQTVFSQGALFEVEKVMFCRGVENMNPIGVFQSNADIQKGDPIYVWMQIRGNEAAIKMLEAWQSLPVYYSWIPAGGGQTGLVDIGIKQRHFARQINALKWEVEKNGYFTWRTYGYSRNLSDGRWTISILDRNKRMVKEIPPPANSVCRPIIAVAMK